jgi:hypothetical protein
MFMCIQDGRMQICSWSEHVFIISHLALTVIVQGDRILAMHTHLCKEQISKSWRVGHWQANTCMFKPEEISPYYVHFG